MTIIDENERPEDYLKDRKTVDSILGAVHISRRYKPVNKLEDLPNGKLEFTDILSGAPIEYWLYGELGHPPPPGANERNVISAAMLTIYQHFVDELGDTVVGLVDNPLAEKAGFMQNWVASNIVTNINDFVTTTFVKDHSKTKTPLMSFAYNFNISAPDDGMPHMLAQWRLIGPHNVNIFLQDWEPTHRPKNNEWKYYKLTVPSHDVSTTNQFETLYLRIQHYDQGSANWSHQQETILKYHAAQYVSDVFTKMFARPDFINMAWDIRNWVEI